MPPNPQYCCPGIDSEACGAAEADFATVHDALDASDAAVGSVAVKRILRLCPECPHAYADWARVLIRAGDYQQSSVILEPWLMRPSDRIAEFLSLKGQVTLRLKDFEAALPFLRRAAELEPESHDFNCDLATTLLGEKRTEEALPYAKAAWRNAPHEDCGIVNLLYCMRSLGEKHELRRILGDIRQEGDQDPNVLNQLARAYATVGRRGVALRLCKRIVQDHPEFVPAWCLAAELQYDLGYANEAEKSLKRVLELDPERHRGYVVLNLAYIKGFIRGDWSGALRDVVEARVAHPDDDEITEASNSVIEAVLGTITAARKETRELSERYAAIHREHDELRVVFEGFERGEQGIPVAVALRRLEGQDVEFMDRFPEQAHELAKEIAAFSTRNDGCIFLGVADDGSIAGIKGLESPKSRDALVDRIAGITANAVVPPAHVEVYFRQYDGETLVKIFVPKGPEPVYYVNGIPYVRHLDQSRRALPDEVKQLILGSQPK